jgi:hypothetical protein
MPGISIYLVGEKIHDLRLGFTYAKEIVVVFFSLIKPNILCIKEIFGGISPLR